MHFQAHTGTFSYIQQLPVIFRNIQAYLSIIETYRARLKHSGLCRTRAYTTVLYSESSPNQNLRQLQEPAKALKLKKNIHGPGIVRTIYSSIFKDIQGCSRILMHIQPDSQPYSGIFRNLCKACICRNVAHLQAFCNCIPTHTQN